jgi:hypothetical protein
MGSLNCIEEEGNSFEGIVEVHYVSLMMNEFILNISNLLEAETHDEVKEDILLERGEIVRVYLNIRIRIPSHTSHCSKILNSV